MSDLFLHFGYRLYQTRVFWVHRQIVYGSFHLFVCEPFMLRIILFSTDLQSRSLPVDWINAAFIFDPPRPPCSEASTQRGAASIGMGHNRHDVFVTWRVWCPPIKASSVAWSPAWSRCTPPRGPGLLLAQKCSLSLVLQYIVCFN